MMQENRSGRQTEIHITQMRRNPYLVDYQTGKNMGRHTGRRTEQRHHSAVPQQENRIRQQKPTRKLRLLYLMETYAETIPATRAQDNA